MLLPAISILIAIICGLTFWCAASQQGTCFVIKLVAGRFGSSATSVQGTIINGLKIGNLNISNKGMDCNLTDLYLHIKWESLLRGFFRASELSIKSAIFNLKASEKNTSSNDIGFNFPSCVKADLFSIDSIAIYNKNDELVIEACNLLASINPDKNLSGFVLEKLNIQSNSVNASINGIFKVTSSNDNMFSACADVIVRNNSSMSKILRTDSMNFLLNVRANGNLDRVDIDFNAANEDFIIEGSSILAICGKPSVVSCTLDINSRNNGGRAYFSISRQNKSSCKFFSLDCHVDSLDSSLIFNNKVPSLFLNLVSNANFEILDNDGCNINVDAKILDDSKWNNNKLSGSLKTDLSFISKDSYLDDLQYIDYLSNIFIRFLEFDISINNNKVLISNIFNELQHYLSINAELPNLSDIWPNISGSVNLDIGSKGLLKNHSVGLNASLDKVKVGNFARWKHVALSSCFSVALNQNPDRLWLFRLCEISANFDDLLIYLNKSSDVNLSLGVDLSNLTWTLGKFCIVFKSYKHGELVLEHFLSSGCRNTLETKGKFKNLLSDSLIFSDISKLLGVKFDIPCINDDLLGMSSPFPMLGEWDVSFSENLQGYIEIKAYDKFIGDSIISRSTPIFTMLLEAKAKSSRFSDLNVYIKLKDPYIGFVDTNAALILCFDDNFIGLVINKNCFMDINMKINDLSIVNRFLRDDLEIGGSLHSIINFIGSDDGRWNINGSISIEELRLFMLDKGIYLANGCLLSHLEGRKFIVDKLNFPSTSSIKHKEIHGNNPTLSNKNLGDGYILCNGYFNLEDLNGKFFSRIQKFPILQSSDCYALVSGNVDMDISFPTFSLTGKLIADDGLVNLDHMFRASTLDDDVIVQHFGALKNKSGNFFLLPNIDLLFDLGDKFRISVFGLNTGLFGSIRTSLKDNGRLVGIGTLKANDGIIDAYGKRLKIKHGSLTFQGQFNNPLIDIEALKSGELIESGIRVSGTLQKPVVTLISYPDVSDVEKLSWLILGRGPEDNASDISLLYSVGTALLGRGQSLYRQLGLSDVSIKNGSVGSFDSLFPGQTVVGSLIHDEYDSMSTQFVVASKRFSNGVDLSIEQSLARTETVGRISYRLSHSWSFDIKVGSVNGAAFICRAFFE
ncbi:hypothetical protein CKBE_00251 [Candidatus Kinetoplastibacterium blastocrithidii (ex Strigomonas culicis)]|nr:hypothetical protein CKBE_00251 [Candidatus Kinetoplastibacterium blastocrithidii (ex Strigomonas culicis)]